MKVEDLEKVLNNGLVLDHLPRIEDERADQPNIGKVVSNIINNYEDNSVNCGFHKPY